jgi:hypothetical protein
VVLQGLVEHLALERDLFLIALRHQGMTDLGLRLMYPVVAQGGQETSKVASPAHHRRALDSVLRPLERTHLLLVLELHVELLHLLLEDLVLVRFLLRGVQLEFAHHCLYFL